MPERRTFIVVPCYNEANRLDPTPFREALAGDESLSFLFVDDGSVDGTAEVLSRIRETSPERIFVLALRENAGKGEAVRRGVLDAAGRPECEIVGYVDADLATPLDQVTVLVRALERHPSAVMVFGSRVKLLGRDVKRWALRHYVGRVFATAASVILGLGVYDTQCGAKVFRVETAREVFRRPFIGPWVFDVEIFARLVELLGRDRAERDLIEIPLETWRDMGDSRIQPEQLLHVPWQLAAIALRYRKALRQKR